MSATQAVCQRIQARPVQFSEQKRLPLFGVFKSNIFILYSNGLLTKATKVWLVHLMKLFSSVSQVHIEFQIFPSTNKLLEWNYCFQDKKSKEVIVINYCYCGYCCCHGLLSVIDR